MSALTRWLGRLAIKWDVKWDGIPYSLIYIYIFFIHWIRPFLLMPLIRVLFLNCNAFLPILSIFFSWSFVERPNIHNLLTVKKILLLSFMWNGINKNWPLCELAPEYERMKSLQNAQNKVNKMRSKICLFLDLFAMCHLQIASFTMKLFNT